jgi:hypothetical protein
MNEDEDGNIAEQGLANGWTSMETTETDFSDPKTFNIQVPLDTVQVNPDIRPEMTVPFYPELDYYVEPDYSVSNSPVPEPDYSYSGSRGSWASITTFTDPFPKSYAVVPLPRQNHLHPPNRHQQVFDLLNNIPYKKPTISRQPRNLNDLDKPSPSDKKLDHSPSNIKAPVPNFSRALPMDSMFPPQGYNPAEDSDFYTPMSSKGLSYKHRWHSDSALHLSQRHQAGWGDWCKPHDCDSSSNGSVNSEEILVFASELFRPRNSKRKQFGSAAELLGASSSYQFQRNSSRNIDSDSPKLDNSAIKDFVPEAQEGNQNASVSSDSSSGYTSDSLTRRQKDIKPTYIL